MSESEGDGAFTAEIGDPVPGKNAFDANDVVCPVQGYDLLKGFRSGRQVLVLDNRTGMVHDTDIHRPCVQIDFGVELMLCFVESHKGPPVKDFISYYRAFMSINCFKQIRLFSRFLLMQERAPITAHCLSKR
jgi:hypothetical protein